jgi:hypothetical protein
VNACVCCLRPRPALDAGGRCPGCARVCRPGPPGDYCPTCGRGLYETAAGRPYCYYCDREGVARVKKD